MVARFVLLCCLVRLAHALTVGPEGQVALLRCNKRDNKVCNVLQLNIVDPAQSLRLMDAEQKTVLDVKGGSIVALRTSHCDMLGSFERVTIGRTGLQELCVSPFFRQLKAEHNGIHTLHVGGGRPYLLEILKLADNKLASIEPIAAFRALRELNLERNVLTSIEMDTFKEMRQLERLSLAGNRLSFVSSGAIQLPRLGYLGLANNTLTSLDVQRWDMAELATLELASNYLTLVTGLGQLGGLSMVTLAGNQWQCMALEGMLETLEDNGVEVVDADRECGGLRNSSICCRVVQNPSELQLQDELHKYVRLEKRYNETSARLEAQIQTHRQTFDSALEQVQKAAQEAAAFSFGKTSSEPPVSCGKKSVVAPTSTIKPPATTTVSERDDQDQANESSSDDVKSATSPSFANAGEIADTTPAVTSTTELAANEEGEQPDADLPVEPTCLSSEESCLCPREELATVRTRLEELRTMLERTVRTVNVTLENRPYQTQRETMLRHEIRTAVGRGDAKLLEVQSQFAMLRDHIKAKLAALV